MRNAGLNEAQAGIKIARRNIISLRYADDTTLLLKLFQKIAEEGMLLNSFYKASITLILNLDKDITERKLQANITDEHTYKNLQQNIIKPNSMIH